MSARAKTAILAPNNIKLVSPATYWEIAIKVNLGKYHLTEPYAEFIQHAIIDNGFDILPVEPRHTELLIGMPNHHKDPFDRLLVAQATVESIPIVSADGALDPYGITRLW